MTRDNAQRTADVIAMVSFSYVTGMGIEVGIAGMSWSQSIFSRNASIPLNILTARPFGLFRDALLRRSGAQGLWARAVIDLVAFLCFQIPVYLIVLTFSGASLDQMVRAVTSVIGLFVVMGPPYGWWLERCRSWTSRWVSEGESA